MRTFFYSILFEVLVYFSKKKKKIVMQANFGEQLNIEQ